ncbi:MAG: ATP-binding cassette domain-containing protein [Deferribacteres bacterium]|nr:ATP-binding cassette domain-containing protein [candidate division KSB1 bacterium]MCB9501647.1 ATP-binding cassette domain-containing protein [Deferribacteres bacterium]
MALISLQDIKFAYGGRLLFENVNLQIQHGERISLVGRNGTGKSTLLRLMHGEEVQSDGTISRQQDLRISYLPQDVPEQIDGTVFDIVADGLGKISELLHQYHDTSLHLANHYTEKDLNKLSRLQEELEHIDGWQVHQKVETVLSHMNLDADIRFNNLSAGLKRRTLLAKGLVQQPDILLLDEPTNHLDIEAIDWLEDFLLRYSGTLVFVTHDRVFLQKLATRIIELDLLTLHNWDCDYPIYLKRKEALLQAETEENQRFDKKLAQEEIWIRKGIKARRTRNEGRVRELQKMREQRRNRLQRDGAAKMQLHEADRSGHLVLQADDISFAYAQNPIFSDFSTTIIRGDKIGIIGPNGVGKSTLMKALLGDLSPQSGTIKYGVRLQVAYFDQLRDQLNDEQSVIENVSEGRDTLEINGTKRHIISYLQDFLFSPERCRVPVKVLSGGERNRVLLAKLFTRAANVLVLDEPTNDLDAETLELLENLLVEFSGTILLVSHDRAFLNNVVTSTIAFTGKGMAKEFIGGYDDYLRQRQVNLPPSIAKTKKDNRKPAKERERKLSFKEKQELEKLPLEIENLESEQSTIFTQLGDPEFYKENGEAVAGMKNRLQELEEELSKKYQRWEELEEINQ